MKTNTLIVATLLLLSSALVKATVITVSNNPVGAGTYTDVQSAITAASVGDTIYIMGSPLQYNAGGINVTKRLTLIGAGYAYNGTDNNLITYTGDINFDSTTVGIQVSGTQIIGIYTNNIGYANGNTVSNIIISRCYCPSGINTYTGSGWVVENCIIGGALDFYGGPTNIIVNNIVRNNFFIGGIYANAIETSSGLLVDHNIFEGPIGEMTFATITNNIFFYADISGSADEAYNVYTDNITVYSSADDLPFGTNTGSGNQNNVAPASVFGSGLTATVGYPALLTDNWHLVSGSPGHNAATDGTDIGIYGGSLPMPNFTGASTLPQMELLNVKNPAIPVNGTLNYEFKARIQN